jgi:putative ABC transport system permease protein
MKYFPFIWANLRRKPIRTVFAILSLVFAFTLLGLVFGLEVRLRQIIESAHGDRIHTVARFAGKLRLAQMDQISKMTDISDVGAMDGVVGYYQRPENNFPILMLGSGMRQVFPELLPTSREWQMLAARRDGVIVSSLFSMKYGLRVGGALGVISSGTPKAKGSDAWTLEVLEIVPDISLMPVGFAVGSYDYLEQVRPQAERGDVQQFWSIAKDAGRADAVRREIDKRFSDSAVPTRSVSEKVLFQSTAAGGGDVIVALTIMAVVGMAMIMFLTANAWRHSICERTTELAVLKTLGFSSMAILTLVFVEVALPCLSGALLGLGLAAGTSVAMPLILPAGVTLPPPKIGFEVVASGVGAALLITLAAAATPVLRIARLDVATVLARH